MRSGYVRHSESGEGTCGVTLEMDQGVIFTGCFASDNVKWALKKDWIGSWWNRDLHRAAKRVRP